MVKICVLSRQKLNLKRKSCWKAHEAYRSQCNLSWGRCPSLGHQGHPSPGLGVYSSPGWRDPCAGVSSGHVWGTPSQVWGPPSHDWGSPWKGPGTRDLGKNLGLVYLRKGSGTRNLGKNLGLGYPWKEPGTRHLGKNLGLGCSPSGVDWQTNWKYYLPPSFGCGR